MNPNELPWYDPAALAYGSGVLGQYPDKLNVAGKALLNPLETVSGLMSWLSPGGDMQDAVSASADTAAAIRSGDVLGTLGGMGGMGLALAGTVLPGRPAQAADEMSHALQDWLPGHAPGGEADAVNEADRLRRAQEMGFAIDEPVYHWSSSPDAFNEFSTKTVDPLRTSFLDALGTHTGTVEAADARRRSYQRGMKGEPSGFTMPLYIKKDRLYTKPDGSPYTEAELRARLSKQYGDKGRTAQATMRRDIWQNYDAIPYINAREDRGSVSYITPPENMRSVHAQFDKARIGDKDLLASIAALTAGTGLAALALDGDNGS